MNPPHSASRPARASARAARGGFTLLETLLVLAILAFVAGMVLLAQAALLRRERLNSACATVETYVRRAAAWAAAHGRPVLLRFDADADARWQLAAADPETLPPLRLPDGVTVGANAIPLALGADGAFTAEAYDGILFTLQAGPQTRAARLGSWGLEFTTP